MCNGGYDVHLGFFATCNGYNRIRARPNPCAESTTTSTKGPTTTRDDGDCCSYKDYLSYIDRYPFQLGGYGCCPNGKWTVASDHMDSSGIRKMYCESGELPVRTAYWYMCPDTSTSKPSSTEETRTWSTIDTTRATKSTMTGTKSTYTRSTESTVETTTKVRTTDDGLCCDKEDLYAWYGVHGANYCWKMGCCPNGEWACIRDDGTMVCDNEVMDGRIGYYHECETTTTSPTKSTETTKTRNTDTTKTRVTGTKTTKTRVTDTTKTRTTECECYVSRTGEQLGYECRDNEKCVPYANVAVTDRRCGYCDDGSRTTSTTAGGNTTETTLDVGNPSNGNMEMTLMAVMFVFSIFGWM